MVTSISAEVAWHDKPGEAPNGVIHGYPLAMTNIARETIGKWWFHGILWDYPLEMTNIAMECYGKYWKMAIEIFSFVFP